MINLSEKIYSLTEQLQKLGDKKTEERIKIEKELQETDNAIDDLVYNLYDMTEEERKLIEKSTKNYVTK